MLQELLAGQVGLVDALLFEALDNLGFGSYRCMVGTGYPACVLAFEPCPAYEDVLNRLVEHMAHMEHTRYVRRWDNHRERLTVVIWLRVEQLMV